MSARAARRCYHRAMRALLLMLMLAALPAVADEIYRTTDEDGNVVFTDQPPSDDAEPITLDPLTTVPAQQPRVPETPGDTGADEGDAATTAGYEGVRVAYPPADQAVRHNGGMVPIRVTLRPEGVGLAEGHTVVVVLDGEAHGAGRGMEVTVGPLDRGPHRVRARIVDRGGRVVTESPSIRFMLLRAALGGQSGGQGSGP